MHDSPAPFSWEGELSDELATRDPVAAPARSSRLTLTVVGAVSAALVLLTIATVQLCGGHFVFSLDDPYITLALSGHIADGHYGLNVAEAASPSSSILYPFLLAAFAHVPWHDWVPLVLNSAAAIATAALFAALLSRYGIGARPQERTRVAFLVVALCLAINIVGLVFTGLEHSLHTLTCVAIVYGLARTFEDDEVPAWLIAVLVLNPLWRFEGAALTYTGVLALAVSGHRRAAVIGFVASSAALGGYMLLMSSLGLPLLPSSVMVKAAPVAGWEAIHDLLGNAAAAAVAYTPHVLLLWLAVVLLALHPILRFRGLVAGAPKMTARREALLASVVIATVAAHALFGRWGGWFRYEVYVLAVAVTGVIVLWHSEMDNFVRRARPRSVYLVGAGILVLGVFYLRGTMLSPFGARSIYEEQYQMHRFAVDFYRRPVAVNDLGWVSYRNPNYVLDLWGLGSETARKARMTTHGQGWMDELTRSHAVGLAMIYPMWFRNEVPPSWHRIAVLHSAHPAVTAALNEVSVYATSPGAEGDALAALQQFALATPPTVATVVFTH